MGLEYNRETPIIGNLNLSTTENKIRVLAVRDGNPIYVDLDNIFRDNIQSSITDTSSDNDLITYNGLKAYMTSRYVRGERGPVGSTSRITSGSRVLNKFTVRPHIFRVLLDNGIFFNGIKLKCSNGKFIAPFGKSIYSTEFYETHPTNS